MTVKERKLNLAKHIKNTTFLKMLLKGWLVNNKKAQDTYGYSKDSNLGFLGFWKKRIKIAERIHALLYSPDVVMMYTESPITSDELDEYHAIFDMSKLQQATSLLRPVGKRKRKLDDNEKVKLYISPKKDFPCMLMNKNGTIIVAPRVE